MPDHNDPRTRSRSVAGAVRDSWTSVVTRPPRAIFHWPAVLTLVVLALLLVFGINFLPPRVFDVTLSVDATSEVLELELDPQRDYVWGLPAGSYSLLVADTTRGCETRARFDIACRYDEPTYVRIRRGATVRLEALPRAKVGDDEPSFTLSLVPRENAERGSLFEILGVDGKVIATSTALVAYESGPVSLWRIPLIARRMQIGESLAENVVVADATTARQPILTKGNVRIFARRFAGGSNRYQVQEERFDPADVAQIPGHAATSGALVGLLAFNGAERAFDVTLHTDLTEISVRRLGAQHVIGASMWSIVSKDPASLALWAALVSLISIANYHSARLNNKLAKSTAPATPPAPARRWRTRR